MTTITMTMPTALIQQSLAAWQSSSSTGELLSPNQKIEQTQAAWQSSSSTGETLSPNQKIELEAGLVAAPNIGVRHRSYDTMTNYQIPSAPYKGPAA